MSAAERLVDKSTVMTPTGVAEGLSEGFGLRKYTPDGSCREPGLCFGRFKWREEGGSEKTPMEGSFAVFRWTQETAPQGFKQENQG